jgi:inhibitor of nuclear factor kappa-B kinase subunit alpha
MRALSDVFSDRMISSGIWPAHSPDLDPCDFFFWDRLKDNVFNNNPRTEEELKGNICREIANIPAEQLQRVNQNFFPQCEDCLRVTGQHFNISCDV